MKRLAGGISRSMRGQASGRKIARAHALAIRLHERALAGWLQDLGLDDPATLAARSTLAEAYREAGRLPEAIELFEQNLAAWRRIHGADHP